MDTNTIDIVALDEANKKVNLIIMDDQNWDDARAHIDLIHEKILSYVAFVENGSLKKKYPAVADLDLIIKVFFENPPSEEGQEFIDQVQLVLDDIGYHLEFVDYTSI